MNLALVASTTNGYLWPNLSATNITRLSNEFEIILNFLIIKCEAFRIIYDAQ